MIKENLGQRIFELMQEVIREFPEPSGCINGSRNIFKDIFIEILLILDSVRLNIKDEKQVEKEELFQIKVLCTDQDLLSIKEKITDLGLEYVLTKIINR